MKRFIALLLCIFTLTASGCGQEMNLTLPFAPEDIDSIEAYHYEETPAAAEKKVLTDSASIRELYESLCSLAVKDDHLESQTGAAVTSFRFDLADGTDFEIIYIGYGVKRGQLISNGNFDYQTEADVGGIWFDIPAGASAAEEQEFPTI